MKRWQRDTYLISLGVPGFPNDTVRALAQFFDLMVLLEVAFCGLHICFCWFCCDLQKLID